ncbi:MAG: hypothetical protein U0235_28295 [Polyangiaceae bacterium]
MNLAPGLVARQGADGERFPTPEHPQRGLRDLDRLGNDALVLLDVP